MERVRLSIGKRDAGQDLLACVRHAVGKSAGVAIQRPRRVDLCISHRKIRAPRVRVMKSICESSDSVRGWSTVCTCTIRRYQRSSKRVRDWQTERRTHGGKVNDISVPIFNLGGKYKRRLRGGTGRPHVVVDVIRREGVNRSA